MTARTALTVSTLAKVYPSDLGHDARGLTGYSPSENSMATRRGRKFAFGVFAV